MEPLYIIFFFPFITHINFYLCGQLVEAMYHEIFHETKDKLEERTIFSGVFLFKKKIHIK